MKKSNDAKKAKVHASLIPLMDQLSESSCESVFSHVGKEESIVFVTNNENFIVLMGNRKPDKVMHGDMVEYSFPMSKTKWKKLLQFLSQDNKPKTKRQGRELSPEHLAKLQAGRKTKVKA